jgi:threonine dehydrogenase-like Zn-dependent dehydrogenase
MRVAVLYGPRDVRFEERDEPKIIRSTDAVISISSACVCGSDLWPYRRIQPIAQPTLWVTSTAGSLKKLADCGRGDHPD